MSVYTVRYRSHGYPFDLVAHGVAEADVRWIAGEGRLIWVTPALPEEAS